MSKIKISELGAATGNGLDKDSIAPIVDAADDTTKKLTIEGLKAALAYGNTLNSTSNGTYIAAGVSNEITGTSNFIGGGSTNEFASGSLGVIAGGAFNTITSNANAAAILGGNNNTASGNFSAVGGGTGNTASGISSVALGGNGNTASGNYSIVGVQDSTASAARSVVLGKSCNSASTASDSVVTGEYGRSLLKGQRSHAAGRFTLTGDAQYVDFVARNRTEDATPLELFLNGTNARLTLEENSAMFLTVEVSGFSETGADAAHYIRKVAISNVANTTALIGSVSTIGTDVETQAGYDVAITADDTNEALVITVTGAAATNIRWVAFISGTLIKMPA